MAAEALKAPRLSEKMRREQENQDCIGGMRNPNSAVARNGALRAVGLRLRRRFEDFVKVHPAILEIGQNFGSASYTGPSADSIERLRDTIRNELKIVKVASPAPKWGKVSTLQPDLVDGWLKEAGDPEVSLGTWIREGAPLGMAKPIPCHGIFPDARGDDVIDEDSQAWLADAVGECMTNYSSITLFKEDAEIELGRLVNEKYGVELKEEDALTQFPEARGCVSKLAIIVKEKVDGTVKRRVIVDLRRSGANAIARVPERPVLPRLMDAAHSVTNILAPDAMHNDDDDDTELVTGDFKDAYMHFRTHPDELPNVFSRHVAPGVLLLWVHMCFG